MRPGPSVGRHLLDSSASRKLFASRERPRSGPGRHASEYPPLLDPGRGFFPAGPARPRFAYQGEAGAESAHPLPAIRPGGWQVSRRATRGGPQRDPRGSGPRFPAGSCRPRPPVECIRPRLQVQVGDRERRQLPLSQPCQQKRLIDQRSLPPEADETHNCFRAEVSVGFPLPFSPADSPGVSHRTNRCDRQNAREFLCRQRPALSPGVGLLICLGHSVEIVGQEAAGLYAPVYTLRGQE